MEKKFIAQEVDPDIGGQNNETPIIFDDTGRINFGEDGTFDHTFFLNGTPAIQARGFYDHKTGEIYIAKIWKQPEIKKRGLADIALESLVEQARKKGFGVKKITAEASPLFVQSLKGGRFSKQLTVGEEIEGGHRGIIINLENDPHNGNS